MADSENQSLKLQLLGPAAESAGKTFQDVWDVIFGGFGLFAKKKRFLREQNFEEFKKSVESRVLEIPSEAIKEPSFSILGPTLEASKFYFEEKPLREMFAALAAASIDKRKEEELHPSYPEIIKQMSPLDAGNLALFRSQLPVAEYYKKKKTNESRRTILTNVFLENSEVEDLFVQSRSLASLSRLGLIGIEYEKTLLADKYYPKFFTTTLFLSMASAESNEFMPGVTFGRAWLTPLGKAFRNVCLE